MSAMVSPATDWHWPADVLAFAKQEHVEGYLEPLLAVLRRLYPTAQVMRAELDEDPEIRDERHITFEVRVPQRDIPDYIAATDLWYDELIRICPGPLLCIFRLMLIPIEA